MTYASSAFFKIGKKRKDIARFLSIVFEAYFPGGEGFVYKKMPGAKETVRQIPSQVFSGQPPCTSASVVSFNPNRSLGFLCVVRQREIL